MANYSFEFGAEGLLERRGKEFGANSNEFARVFFVSVEGAVPQIKSNVSLIDGVPGIETVNEDRRFLRCNSCV